VDSAIVKARAVDFGIMDCQVVNLKVLVSGAPHVKLTGSEMQCKTYLYVTENR